MFIFRQNCDEIRPHLRQKLLEDSKYGQRLQIEDKKKQKDTEKDYENMWSGISKKCYNQMVASSYTLCQLLCFQF